LCGEKTSQREYSTLTTELQFEWDSNKAVKNLEKHQVSFEEKSSFMQKPSDPDDYELRDEYDLSTMTIVAKGRYAPHRRVGKNIVLLAPDVVQAFPTDEAVNEALRLVMRIAEVPSKYSTEPVSA
jgi:hypothetical protein